MAIKQIGVYNGSGWDLEDIGASASNITLSNTLAGSNNLQTVLNNILPTSKLTANKWVGTDTNGKLVSKNPPVVTPIEYASVQGSANTPVIIGTKITGAGQFLLQASQADKTISLFKRLDASGTEVDQTIFTMSPYTLKSATDVPSETLVLPGIYIFDQEDASTKSTFSPTYIISNGGGTTETFYSGIIEVFSSGFSTGALVIQRFYVVEETSGLNGHIEHKWMRSSVINASGKLQPRSWSFCY